MKILVLANNDDGLYKFRRELLSELLKENEVAVSVPCGNSSGRLSSLGCNVIDTRIDRRGVNPFRDLKLFREYGRVIKKENPGLVITYTVKPNIYGGFACRRKKIPYAVNITGLGTAFQKKGFLRSIVTLMYRTALKKARVVFFENCENMRIFIDEKIVSPSVCCLLNGAGVNLDYFSYADYPAEREETKFLFSGRVMKEKGIDELLSAMRILRGEGLKCTLDIIGRYEDDYRAVIEQCAGEGWLRYHGYQDDVRPFIKNCDCFVLPSWHEGMANTNLECAASGRPVITSNIHGCLEAVEDGKSGFLCEKKNAESLADCMRRFIALPYEEKVKMGIAGRKRMEEFFDKRAVVEKTVKELF